MTLDQIPRDKIVDRWGAYVRTLTFWAGIPVGTIGIIDEVYDHGNGVTVAWREPGREELFINYARRLHSDVQDGRNLTYRWQMTIDGFHRSDDVAQDEFKFLELLVNISSST
jgi:hypothetical protein